MKKVLSLILALVMCLALCACGGKSDAETEKKAPETTKETVKEEVSPEDVVLKVSDTAEGEICSVTIKSVEYVDEIEKGYKEDLWGYDGSIKYKNVVAKEGYSILKISYDFKYTGKEKGNSTIDFELDYDNGYTFKGDGGHGNPGIGGLTMGFTMSYTFQSNIIVNVDDPLTFKNTSGDIYIFVNEAVKNNLDKPCVLKVTMPVSLESESEAETFTYDLR